MAMLAKLTRPRLVGVYPRERLFARLDQCRSRAAVWISGPPGAGKTTLAASYLDARGLPALWYQVDAGDADPASFFYYLGFGVKQVGLAKKAHLPLLTPEYLSDLSGYTRRYFRTLCHALPQPCVLVFDNCQEVPDSAPFADIVRDALAEIPQGINAILISRAEPAPQHARLRASHILTELGWEELRLTTEEAEHIASNAHRTATPGSVDLAEHCGGWVGGLVLLLDHTRATGRGAETPASREALFDYFAAELFDRLSPEMRHLVLRTALVPWISVPMAQALTGNSGAGSLLESLRRKHLFTDRRAGPVASYQYHQLFREFLTARVQQIYTPSEQLRLAHKSAQLLARGEDAGAALHLYLTSGDEGAAVELVLANAPAMATQGRLQTLASWFGELREETVRGDPWLQYWLAKCLLWGDPSRSLAGFESAFAQFRKTRDITGAYLAWCGAVQAIMYDWNGSYLRWDGWIATLDELRTEFPEFPTREIEFKVAHAAATWLIWLRPTNSQVLYWRERLLQLAEASNDQSTIVEVQGWRLVSELFYGKDIEARAALESIQHLLASDSVSPFASTLASTWMALYHLSMGRIDEGRATARLGLEIAANTGCHVNDFHLVHYAGVAALLANDGKAAAESLSRMGRMPASRASAGAYLYRQFALNCAISEGDFPGARTQAELYRAVAEQIGAPLLLAQANAALAVVLFELTEVQQAFKHLGEALGLAREAHSPWNEWGCMCHEAYFAFRIMDEERGFSVLARAFAIGAAQGYRTTTLLFPKEMCFLCKKALERNIEVQYTRSFITTGFLRDPEPPLDCENWPWAIKIASIGRFEILCNDQLVRFEGKAQRKPMELLKALIALGGHDVPVEKLVDILWAEPLAGDEQKAFDVTVHRLRKLFGHERAIQVTDRRVSLNRELVWVDLWALESKLARLIPATHTTTPDAAELARAAPAILTLYRGHFLAGDGDSAWLLPVRNRLRGRFQRFVLRLGEHWERARHWTQAAELYQRGVELDPLAELFYRRLMICLREQGQPAEAIEAFRRCRQMLSVTLGVKPTAETEAVYRGLLGS